MALTAKVTVSIPLHVLAAVDAIARERKAPRSNVIAEMLKKRVEEIEEESMINGYKALAKENVALAETGLSVVAEVLPEWK